MTSTAPAPFGAQLPLSQLAAGLEVLHDVLVGHASAVDNDQTLLSRMDPPAWARSVQRWADDLEELQALLDDLRFSGKWVLMPADELPMEKRPD